MPKGTRAILFYPGVSSTLIPTSAELPLPTNANEPIQTLRTYVLKLPDYLEDGQDVDEVTQHCYHEGLWADALSNGDAWEHWNGVLDMLIQKRPTETMEAYRSRLVKRGPKGTETPYRVLAYVMEKVVVAPDMLDGKIGRLTDAIRKKCLEITVSEPTPSRPNPAESSSSPSRRHLPSQAPVLQSVPSKQPLMMTPRNAITVSEPTPSRPNPAESSSSPSRRHRPFPSSSPTKRPFETTIDDDTKPSWVIRMEEFLLPDIEGTLWRDAVEVLVTWSLSMGTKPPPSACQNTTGLRYAEVKKKSALPRSYGRNDCRQDGVRHSNLVEFNPA
ncbi:hypothetical protein K435DRAFT_854278 [Dendrothele bispora CBS 962.96]|uniref:Uncharacterized protein n=1 Tax=Dendrothele bispora (strain CBS 962.96) TaxID=1314807 RepID=A0A4S8ME67_DENBC|nr:hypothetical protein K435DRAFT_854278 [Dendrothele bispora CBS 962.96]